MSSTKRNKDDTTDITSNTPQTSIDDSIVLENVEYPVLSLRDLVIFPKNTASLFVGRRASLEAAQASYHYNTPIILLTQKDAKTENPDLKDLYQIGTLARIKRYVMMPDGTLNLAVEGLHRIKVVKLNTFGKYYTAFVKKEDFTEAKTEDENIK